MTAMHPTRRGFWPLAEPTRSSESRSQIVTNAAAEMTESKSLVPMHRKKSCFTRPSLWLCVCSIMAFSYRQADFNLSCVDCGRQYRRSPRDSVLFKEIRRIAVTATRRGTQPILLEIVICVFITNTEIYSQSKQRHCRPMLCWLLTCLEYA